ncbi:FCD domain-containing protein [Rhodobacterales bacterium HKCCE2091]|nr:FCD domain-containing protein [Rhodobacterales bacterium HKCCE2091]
MAEGAEAVTQRHDIFVELRRDIIFGRLSAGERLNPAALRDRYGVSASTLREKLLRLAEEGFVTGEGKRGYFVADMSAERLREIAELRVLLECHALRKSLENGDTEWEAEIVAAHHRLHRLEERMRAGEEGVRETWKHYDWEFHQALISACGSAELMDLHGSVFDKYLRYQMRLLTFRGDIAATEHRQMLDAALARDAARAEAVLRAHIEGGVDHCLTYYTEGGDDPESD